MKKIVFLVLVFLSLYGCENEKVKPGISKGSLGEIPAQESWNSQISFYDSGLVKAVLNTGHLSMFTERRETILDENVKVDFYDQQEVKTTTLTSKRGRVDDATTNLYAIDSVVVVSTSGTKIETEELMWKNQERKITSDKFVVITTPTERIEGIGFESDQSLKNYVIYKITFVAQNDSI